METKTLPLKRGFSLSKFISGTFLIAGTTIGAGMLGIPLLTAQAGFWPALAITGIVWAFMVCTGMLFVEAALWMPEGSNILSMASRFLGTKGRWAVGGIFVFLYYCLLIAYFAAGAPLLAGFFGSLFGIEIGATAGYLLFALIFGGIIALGARSINRTNIILTVGMLLAYCALVGMGSKEVSETRLAVSYWPASIFAIPLLFSAFGYHNVVPSLCSYLNRDRKLLHWSIIGGTGIAFILFVVWQWLIIGAVPQEQIASALALGQPATEALQSVAGNSWIYLSGRYFALFAITTSVLGVSFSMIDFLADGLKMAKTGLKRVFLTALTIAPPLGCAILDPTLFDKALGVAGGFGEALLNGLVPVLLVWVGRYREKLPQVGGIRGGKVALSLLMAFSLFVFGLELVQLIK